jgi:hypothetical protein
MSPADLAGRCGFYCDRPTAGIGIRIVTFKACSGFVHAKAHHIAQPP